MVVGTTLFAAARTGRTGRTGTIIGRIIAPPGRIVAWLAPPAKELGRNGEIMNLQPD